MPKKEPVCVLLAVNAHETRAVLDAFVGEGRAPKPNPRNGIVYHDCGVHYGKRIVHVICEMGSGSIGATQQRTRDAIDHWKPDAVIGVGIAFGMDETSQRIGDVLVSTQVQGYDARRVNDDGTITPRADKPHASDSLISCLRQTDAGGDATRRIGPPCVSGACSAARNSLIILMIGKA